MKWLLAGCGAAIFHAWCIQVSVCRVRDWTADKANAAGRRKRRRGRWTLRHLPPFKPNILLWQKRFNYSIRKTLDCPKENLLLFMAGIKHQNSFCQHIYNLGWGRTNIWLKIPCRANLCLILTKIKHSWTCSILVSQTSRISGKSTYGIGFTELVS